MKLISNEMRMVDFHGVNILTPIGYKFMASDGRGLVHIFHHKPIPIDDFEIWVSTGKYASIATVGLESMNWVETLIEI